MSSVIECLEERHVYLKENDKYFRKYHTKMAPVLQNEIETAYLEKEISRMYDRLAKTGRDTGNVSEKLTKLKKRRKELAE